MEAAQGRAPCGYCAAVNASPVNAPAVNPYGPPTPWQLAAQGATAGVAPPWTCGECRKENEGHYEFCLGCGGARRSGARGHDGNAVESRQRSPVVLIAVIIAALV